MVGFNGVVAKVGVMWGEPPSLFGSGERWIQVVEYVFYLFQALERSRPVRLDGALDVDKEGYRDAGDAVTLGDFSLRVEQNGVS